MKLIYLLFGVFLSASASASSVSVVEETGGIEDKGNWLAIFAYSDAYSWVNVVNESEGHDALYCQPSKLALRVEQVWDIVLRFLESTEKYDKQSPLGIVVLRALQSTFPC